MIKVGVIGLGRMGNTHIPFLNENENSKVVAGYDPKAEAAQAAKQAYGLDLCSSAEELVNRKDVDAVFICSPTYCHLEGLRPAFNAGKPVFCEKPLCRTVAEADQIMAMAEHSRSVATIGFVRRHALGQQAFTKIIESGKLGKLRHANVDLTFGAFKRLRGDWFADYELSGGVVLDMLSHHLDLLLWNFGEVESLYSAGLLGGMGLPLPGDYNSTILKFRNGVICNVTCAWNRAGRSANYQDVYGDDGCASYSWCAKEIDCQMTGKDAEKIPITDDVNPYKREDDSWISSILNGSKPKVTLMDGYKAFKLANDMLLSSKKHLIINY